MKKKLLLIIMLLFVISISLTGCKKNNDSNNKQEENETIPSDYMFYFAGGNDKITYMTYIYKIDNNQDNYGFKYINTTKKEVDGKEIEEIVGKGEVSWTEDVFVVARKHGAYSYVQYNGLVNQYTIDEFQVRFLMD